MAENSILETLGQVAGIGGISLGVLLLIFKEIIRKNIFPGLNRQQAYNILKLIILLTFFVAIAGIAAWLWSETIKINNQNGVDPIPEQEDFRRIYFQGFDNVPDDELNQMWLKGDSDDWRGSMDDSMHTLCNISDSESASFTSTFRYIKADGLEADLSNSKATVRVQIRPPSARYSSAGIMFRKLVNKPGYYAFVLNSGNSVSLMRRSGDAMKIVWTKEINNIEGSVKLSIVGNDNHLNMYVNDEFIASEVEETMSYGNPGVFAYSTGCFVFDEFSLFQRTD